MHATLRGHGSSCGSNMENTDNETGQATRAISISRVCNDIGGQFAADVGTCYNEGSQSNRHSDLQGEGDLSLSLQIQDKRIANPFELQAELGLTKWSEERCFAGSNG